MARKRIRRKRDPHTSLDGMNQGHHFQPTMVDGQLVQVRQISNTDEGVLYSHAITVSIYSCFAVCMSCSSFSLTICLFPPPNSLCVATN